MPWHIIRLADADVFGNLLDQTATEIWNGETMMSLRRALSEKRPHRSAAIDASKVAGVDRLDREEHGVAPDALALDQVTQAGGDPVEMTETVLGRVSWSLPSVTGAAEEPGSPQGRALSERDCILVCLAV